MDRVRRAEAALALGVHKSTVTRLCKENPSLVDDAGLVNVDELRRHRDATLNPALQTRGSAAAPERQPSAQGNLNETRSRTEAAKAETAELDLAERLGLTLRRDEVVAAVSAAGDVMRQAAGQLARDRAEALTRIIDVREMERALDDLMREVLTRGAQALTLAAAQPGSSQAA
jgi:plasmid maintenance system antidote protein VapI